MNIKFWVLLPILLAHLASCSLISTTKHWTDPKLSLQQELEFENSESGVNRIKEILYKVAKVNEEQRSQIDAILEANRPVRQEISSEITAFTNFVDTAKEDKDGHFKQKEKMLSQMLVIEAKSTANFEYLKGQIAVLLKPKQIKAIEDYYKNFRATGKPAYNLRAGLMSDD